mmetsp:Transcript_10770/g.44146  ORF Transcript_10770/g.44146 Transcript_10770/m.44146 type:complete len:1538 (-) Transcript_10770:236-4849(-)
MQGTRFSVGSKPPAFKVALELQPTINFPPSEEASSSACTGLFPLLSSPLEIAQAAERHPAVLLLYLPSVESPFHTSKVALWSEAAPLLPDNLIDDIGVYFVEGRGDSSDVEDLAVSVIRYTFQRTTSFPFTSPGDVALRVGDFATTIRRILPPPFKSKTIAHAPVDKAVWFINVAVPLDGARTVQLSFVDRSSDSRAVIDAVYSDIGTFPDGQVQIEDDGSSVTVEIRSTPDGPLLHLPLLLRTIFERYVVDSVFFNPIPSTSAPADVLEIELFMEDPTIDFTLTSDDILEATKRDSYVDYHSEPRMHLGHPVAAQRRFGTGPVHSEELRPRVALGQWQFREVPAQDVGVTAEWRSSMPVAPHCTFDTMLSPTASLPGHFCTLDSSAMCITAADINGDHVEELFSRSGNSLAVYSRVSEDPLFYREISAMVGLSVDVPNGFVSDVAAVDLDLDGHVDVIVACADKTPQDRLLQVFMNRGDGTFHPTRGVHSAVPLTPYGVVSLTIGDYNADGYPDILTQEWMATNRKVGAELGQSVSQARLFMNFGAFRPAFFMDVTVSAGLDTSAFWKRTHFHLARGDYGLSAAFVDLDLDGHLDIVWTGDFGTSTIFWNTGLCNVEITAGRSPEGVCFEEKSLLESGISKEENGMGTTIHDLNGDGLMDFVVSSIHADAHLVTACRSSLECAFGLEGNKAYINLGDRHFAEVASCLGIAQTNWSWGLDFVDFDNDGDLDFFVVNGFSVAGSTNEDLHNDTPDYAFQNVDVECSNGSIDDSSLCSPLDDCLRSRGVLDPSAGSRRLLRYIDVGETVGLNTRGQSKAAIAIDLDGDGDMDVVKVYNTGPPGFFINDVGTESGHLLQVRAITALGTPAWHATIRIWNDNVSGPPDHMKVVGVSSSNFESQAPLTMHFGLGTSVLLHTVEVSFPAPSLTVIRLRNVPVDILLSVQDQGDSFTAEYADIVSATTSHGQRSTVSEDTPEPAAHDAEPEKEAAAAGLPHTSRDMVAFSALVNSWATSILTDSANVTAEFYTIDGRGNNAEHPSWGAPGTLLRMFEAAYEDGVAEAPQQGRSSARAISNALAEQAGDEPSGAGLTAMFTDWGQFLSHDLTLANPLSASMTLENQLPIAVPAGDLVFDLEATGTQLLRFTRTTYAAGSGSEAGGPRQQVNHHSSFIDASNVYGPDEGRSRLLREGGGGGGRMATSADGRLLPREAVSGTAKDNPTGRSSRNLYATGDHRGNEQPGLLALHTLLVREHNLVHDLLVAARPQLSAAEAFELARSFVIAEVQHVTMAEYLPLLVGAAGVPDCAAYDTAVRPQVYNEFAAAAFRFGHSQVGGRLQVGRRGAAGSREVPLRDAFFVPEYLARHGLEAVLAGMATTVAQEVDVHLVEDLRSFLFDSGRGAGLDLFALNVQRGRDHGLPSYLSVSRQLGLDGGCRAFACLPFEAEARAALAGLYAAADDVDLFVGGLLEAHVEGGSVGPVFAELIRRQMHALCVGDRLWYSRRLARLDGGQEAAAVHMGLAAIIARHVESPLPSPFVYADP